MEGTDEVDRVVPGEIEHVTNNSGEGGVNCGDVTTNGEEKPQFVVEVGDNCVTVTVTEQIDQDVAASAELKEAADKSVLDCSRHSWCLDKSGGGWVEQM